MTDKLEPIELKCTPDSWMKVFWNDDPVMEKFFQGGVDTQDPELRHLIKELDRRFCQLWHKIQHENKQRAPD